ncbi:MAG TPA: hypothetical protein VIK30_07930 [Polyangia bacterium]
MAASVAASDFGGGATISRAQAPVQGATWPLGCALASSLTVAFGVHWDIAWHRSIGRDGFWSPPHVAIYAAAILAAVAALAQVLPATFGRGAARHAGVRVLGFRGPLGAFIAAWGGITMLSSAPFDDWWHNAYGLDVKILSPPHVVLGLGIIALHIGALVMLAGAMNRLEPGARRRTLETQMTVVAAMIIVALMTMFMEKTVRPFMHGGSFYLVVGLCVPIVLTAMQGVSGRRWAATGTVAVYSGFLLALLWILPLVPAHPKLGPVLVPTTNLVPPEFPLLLLPAAMALDTWLWRRRARPGLATVAGAALLFTGVFFVCQWPFASFLMSPPARNFFWGAKYFDFWLPPETLYRRYLFIFEPGAALVRGLGFALLGTAASIAAGRAVGRWLARLRR